MRDLTAIVNPRVDAPRSRLSRGGSLENKEYFTGQSSRKAVEIVANGAGELLSEMCVERQRLTLRPTNSVKGYGPRASAFLLSRSLTNEVNATARSLARS